MNDYERLYTRLRVHYDRMKRGVRAHLTQFITHRPQFQDFFRIMDFITTAKVELQVLHETDPLGRWDAYTKATVIKHAEVPYEQWMHLGRSLNQELLLNIAQATLQNRLEKALIAIIRRSERFRIEEDLRHPPPVRQVRQRRHSM
jgi:hypothetical protein